MSSLSFPSAEHTGCVKLRVKIAANLNSIIQKVLRLWQKLEAQPVLHKIQEDENIFDSNWM